jgi:hypothetical protein
MCRLALRLILFGLLSLCVSGQTKVSPLKSDAQIRQLLLSQPDYSATQQFGFVEPRGGFGATTKVAKLGTRFREEDEDRILIREPGKPTVRIYPKRREFSEVVEDESDPKQSDDLAITPEELAKREDVHFRLTGSKNVGGYQCQSIEATYPDDRLEQFKFVFCSAPKLKNVIVYQQAVMGPVTMTTILSNVSFNVSASLFRIPDGYKRVTEKNYDEQFKKLIDGIKQAKPSPQPTP